MSQSPYICPFCGADYYDPEQAKLCAMACAQNISSAASKNTLRNKFAIAALQAILPKAPTTEDRCGPIGIQAYAHDYARAAFVVADAMVKQAKS
jgi:hypothetical protein